MPPLRLTNLVLDNWSCLTGQTVKAANCLGFSAWLVEIAEEFYSDDTDEYCRMVVRTASALNRMYEIIYAAGVFLNDREVRELRRVLAKLGASVMSLRDLARGRGMQAWNVTPKMHMIQHFGAFPANLNPKWVQNYTEESAIGTTTKVWARSASGRYRETVQKMVLLKRLVALVVRLETDGRV